MQHPAGPPRGPGHPHPGQGTGPFVELVSALKIYPLAAASDPPAIQVIRNGDRAFDGDWPKDYGYFQILAEGLGYVQVEPEDKLMYAMLEPLGIGPGRRFDPDDRTRAILARSAETGTAVVATMAFANRFPDRRMWPDRQWEHITFATSPEFVTPAKVEVDERAQAWYQVVGNQRYLYSAKPAPGAGTWYASTFRDANGDFLDGGRHYTLTLTGPPPARQFWSLTAYSNKTRAMIDNDQHRAGLSSYLDLTTSDDGTLVLHLGPTPPHSGPDNWIQAVPEDGYFLMFRLYGPLEPVYNGSWTLNDVEPQPK